MENTESLSQEQERVRWGIKLRFEPKNDSFEIKITLPRGEEDNLQNLLEENVLQAFPEMLRALATGRLPGNELDLANKH